MYFLKVIEVYFVKDLYQWRVTCMMKLGCFEVFKVFVGSFQSSSTAN